MSAASPEVLGGADLLLSVGQRERERESAACRQRRCRGVAVFEGLGLHPSMLYQSKNNEGGGVEEHALSMRQKR